MENISKKDISFRLDKIKTKASEISKKIERNNEEFGNRYNFAKTIGIKVDKINNTTNEVTEELNKYIKKADEIIEKYNNIEDDVELVDEYKLLNNMLYLDDIKLKNIYELVNDNNDLKTKEYINMIASKANELIRQEELKSIDIKINKLSKINFIDKITGKSKIKKAMIENYSLKRVEAINKKYIPDNKSLYEVISITNNCGYKSHEINNFISSIINEFNFDEPSMGALISIQKESKIPFFYNKEFLNKINSENAAMLDRINNKTKSNDKISEYQIYNDMLINDVTTLELFNFNNIEEVI